VAAGASGCCLLQAATATSAAIAPHIANRSIRLLRSADRAKGRSIAHQKTKTAGGCAASAATETPGENLDVPAVGPC
jgi:hypothetical protein